MKSNTTHETQSNHFEQLAQETEQTSVSLWFRAVIEFTQSIAKQMAICDVNRVQLAHRLAVHPSFITKVLKGDTNISVETIAKLSHALNCDFHIQVVPRESFIDEGYLPTSDIVNNTGESKAPSPGFFRFGACYEPVRTFLNGFITGTRNGDLTQRSLAFN
jgi:transcriptional regulator with XRE-family HTH domain